MKTEEQIRRQYEQLRPTLHERARREWAASEAMALGHGGIALVHRATGIVPATIGKGIRELKARASSDAPEVMDPGRVRRPGGGRKKKADTDATLLSDLETLVEPVTRGDPESPLRWTLKSLRRLANELKAMGHDVSYVLVRGLLKSLGYSLQANCKSLEGAKHPDRNAQFEHINARTQQQLDAGNPAISVDTKKKELIGRYKNGGQEYRPKGSPEKVKVHDFIDRKLGKANPYGVYDIGKNEGWVNVGISADTAQFAVESIRRWWEEMGRDAYPQASELLITADCGGSNGYRTRLWKLELQGLADELGFPITVCHVPPGTSKWNKIEHRLFSFISMNWRGKPLVSYEAIVKMISATTTGEGLTVRSMLDENVYEKGRKVTDEEMATIDLVRDTFHGEWNYTIRPRRSQRKPDPADRVIS